jgi:peroxiredoxin
LIEGQNRCPSHAAWSSSMLCSTSRACLPTYHAAPCMLQACKFRDEYETFVKAGAQVFGISSDEPSANKAFADAQRLPFPLLTDPSSIMRKVRGGFAPVQYDSHEFLSLLHVINCTV